MTSSESEVINFKHKFKGINVTEDKLQRWARRLEVSFQVIANDMEPICKNATRSYHVNTSWGFPQFASKSELNAYITDDSITVKVILKPFTYKNPIIRALARMLENEKYSDVELKVGDDVFPCHKSFLVANSKGVFGSMFSTPGSLESQTNFVEIVDMSLKSVGCMLRFLYLEDTDGFSTEPQVAFELLKAGDKYDIKHMEEKAKGILMNIADNRFSLDLAVQIFMYVGKIERFPELEEKAIEVISSKKSLENSDFLKEFMAENPGEAAKVMAKFIHLSKSAVKKRAAKRAKRAKMS